VRRRRQAHAKLAQAVLDHRKPGGRADARGPREVQQAAIHLVVHGYGVCRPVLDHCQLVVPRPGGLVGEQRRVDAAGLTSDDYTVIMALVQAGLGVSLIPRLAAEQLAAEVRLHPVADLHLTRTVSVAVRSGSGGDPAIAALVLALRRAAGRG
jgi:DNA-binding transcriptional LysR family regulator